MLAFSIDYYGIFFGATQFVELFCTYVHLTFYRLAAVIRDMSDIYRYSDYSLLPSRQLYTQQRYRERNCNTVFFARPFCIKLQKLFVGRCSCILQVIASPAGSHGTCQLFKRALQTFFKYFACVEADFTLGQFTHSDC